MFDQLFNAFTAFHQIGFMFGGLVFCAVGFALIGNYIYWHKKAEHKKARIVSVKKTKSTGKNGSAMYRAVVEYQTSRGELVRAESNGSSSSLTDKVPGTRVDILVMPDKPHEYMRVGWFWIVFGAIFVLPGLVLFYISFTAYEFNIFTPIIFFGFIAYIGFKISRAWKKKSVRETIAQFRSRTNEERLKRRGDEPELSQSEVREQLKKYTSANRWLTPIFGIIAIGLMAGAYYMGKDVAALTATGLRADGKVVRIEQQHSSSSSGSSTTYYPIVSFRDKSGNQHEFRDQFGSNPASYSTGEAVTVLYDRHNQKKMQIDRGIGNWTVPAIFGVIGSLLLLGSIHSSRSSRKYQRY